MQGLALHTQIKHTANRSSKSLVMTGNRVTQFTVTAKYHEPYLQVDDQLSSKQDYTENWRVRVWLFFTEAFRSRGSKGVDRGGVDQVLQLIKALFLLLLISLFIWPCSCFLVLF